MNFELTDDQELIRRSVAELAAKFDDQYWMHEDQTHEFPQEFYDAIAGGGWLGLTIPEEYGGNGLGITEATLLLEEIARSGAAMNAASTPPASPPSPHVVATAPAIITWSRAKRCGSPRHSSPRRSCCWPDYTP
jgi:alkylation response protein AidB-like acyl-CoA dehydrogenase